MSFSYFLNLERAAMIVIEEQIHQMEDIRYTIIDNVVVEKEIPIFENNIVHGIVACVMTANLLETAINTIIGKQLERGEKTGLRNRIDEKIDIICETYGVKKATVKGTQAYQKIRELIRVRNDLTHYKSNFIGDGSGLSQYASLPMGVSGCLVIDIFTKQWMQNHYENALLFLKRLCEDCSLQFVPDCNVIGCDGASMKFEFIISEEEFC